MKIITKDMKHVIGIYGIRSISDGLFYYIGSSKDVWGRWLDHRIKKGHSQYYNEFHTLLRDNLDDFEPVLLDELVGFIHMDDKIRLRKRLVDREKMYIRKYKALGHPIMTNEENQEGWAIGENNPSKNPDVVEKLRKKSKEMWQDDEFVKQMIEKMKEGWQRRRNRINETK